MKIQSIGDKAFSTYGKVIEGLDTSELLKACLLYTSRCV